MPKSSLVILGTSVIAACNLPSAELQLSNTPTEPAEASDPAPAAHKPRGGADRRRPRVVAAELVTGDLLRLQFSEPLGPLDGVDPNDFRLSMGLAYAYPAYAYAYYLDVGEAVDGDHGPAMLVDMTHSGDTVELHLDPDFDLAYCHELSSEIAAMKAEPGVRADGGLFLHYSPGAKPITDEAGNPLAAVGPDWVEIRRLGGEDLYDLNIEGPAARRAFRDLIPVRCGDGS